MILAKTVRAPTSVRIDQAVMEWLADHRTGWLTWIADRAMDVGLVAAPVFAVLSVVFVLQPRRRVPGVAIGLAGATSLYGSKLLKDLFDRPRPPRELATVWAHGPSFPSSASATTVAVIVVLVATLAWPSDRWRRPAVAGATAVVLLVGWAVMYLGAHWLTDVLAGWALGLLLGWVALRLAPWLVSIVPWGHGQGDRRRRVHSGAGTGEAT